MDEFLKRCKGMSKESKIFVLDLFENLFAHQMLRRTFLLTF